MLYPIELRVLRPEHDINDRMACKGFFWALWSGFGIGTTGTMDQASVPLRILHLMSARAYVGEAARALDLVEAERAAGHDSHLVTRRGFPVTEEARRRNLPVNEANLNGGFHPLLDWQDLAHFRRIIRERGIQILHAHPGQEH